MPDRDTVRRMEGIRRGGGEEAVLADGVKSKRRGHLQGGRPPTSIRESWMSALLDEDSSGGPGYWVKGAQDESRGRRTTTLGSQSPGTQKIRQRIHDAQTALRSLRRTTAAAAVCS
ncbi:unnamed protein product [Pylaiella littoralis]